MAEIIRKPIFCVVLNDGNYWSVEAEWTDGTIEQIQTFKFHSQAMDWLTTRSKAWLECRALSAPQDPRDLPQAAQGHTRRNKLGVGRFWF
jgi:hypothetical protein